jgi:hypothetical protein
MCYRPRSAVAGVALPATVARHKQRCSLSAPARRSVASAAAYERSLSLQQQGGLAKKMTTFALTRTEAIRLLNPIQRKARTRLCMPSRAPCHGVLVENVYFCKEWRRKVESREVGRNQSWEEHWWCQSRMRYFGGFGPHSSNTRGTGVRSAGAVLPIPTQRGIA